MTCFNRMMECFLRRGLEQQYEAVTKSDDSVSTIVCDWDLALIRGLGRDCEICGDATNVATHCCTTCCHSACSACWLSWSENRCLLCNADMPENGVVRAPFDVVPQTKRELASGGGEPTDRVESASNRALEGLVGLKHALGQIRTELASIVTHQAANDEDRSDESRDAVVQVDAACLSMQMQKLAGMLDSSTGCTQCCKNVEALCDAVESLTQDHTIACREGTHVCTLPTQSRKRCRALLQPNGSKRVGAVWWGQMVGIELLRNEIFSDLLPKALAAVGAGGNIDDDEMIHAVTVLSELESKFQDVGTQMEGLLQELEQQSCNLLDQMPSPRTIPFEVVSLLTPTSRIRFDDCLSEDRERIFEEEMAKQESQ